MSVWMSQCEYVCMCVFLCMCMSLCVCLCVYLCVCVSLCVYVCIFVYVYISVFVCLSVCLSVYVYVYVYVCICLCVYVYLWVCVCLYLCACLCESTHTRTHTRTHARTHTCFSWTPNWQYALLSRSIVEVGVLFYLFLLLNLMNVQRRRLNNNMHFIQQLAVSHWGHAIFGVGVFQSHLEPIEYRLLQYYVLFIRRDYAYQTVSVNIWVKRYLPLKKEGRKCFI